MTPTEFLIAIKTLISGLPELADVPVMIDSGQLNLIEDLRNETELGGLGVSVLVAETGMVGENCRGRKVSLKFGVSVYQSCLIAPDQEAVGAKLRDTILRALHTAKLGDDDCLDRICFKSGQVLEHNDATGHCGTIYAMAYESSIYYQPYGVS